MQDARYFRARATYVLDLADLISDRRAVGNLQALAADYVAGAEQLENDDGRSRSQGGNS